MSTPKVRAESLGITYHQKRAILGDLGGMGVNGRFTALMLMFGISLHRTDRSGLMYNSFLESSALYALLILKVIQKIGNLFWAPYFIFLLVEILDRLLLCLA